MATNLIAPNRNEAIVTFEGTQTVRVARFFEALVALAAALPDQAASVAAVSLVAQADATAAGAAYNQAQVQSIVDLANANKVSLNLLITAFNDLLTAVKDANIMAT